MASEKVIHESFEKLAGEIPGFIAASLVDIESGMTLGLKSQPDFDLAAASACSSERVKQKMKIWKALDRHASFEDVLITLGDQIHIIKMVTRSTFIYLAADHSSCNVAIARSVVNRRATSFQ
jgi:hypothetical protein